LSSKVAGLIERVAVVDNQSVKAGDLLVKIDDRDYRAQLAHAEASVALQQATLANLDANRHLQEAMMEQASADIAATTAELARAKCDVDRYRTLSNNRFASLQRFQQADADYEKARAADRKARAALDAAERQLGVIDTQKQRTQAALDRPRQIATSHGLTSAIRKSVHRSTASSATEAPVPRVCDGRRSAFGHRSGIRSVGRGQFQGKSASARARGPTGRDHCRRAAGRRLSWARREPCTGHGCAVQRDPAGECDR
jgi:multidrug efflux pump subunit AcrA (membrane-fusion protein)